MGPIGEKDPSALCSRTASVRQRTCDYSVDPPRQEPMADPVLGTVNRNGNGRERERAECGKEAPWGRTLDGPDVRG